MGVLFETLAEGLDFISRGGRIIYLVDYTEMSPFWNSKRPLRSSDLVQDGVTDVTAYLTGLERIFLELEGQPDYKIDYLGRTYYEQLDFIDALICNHSFDTLISPHHWTLLKDDITYFGNYVDDPLGNFNYAQIQNEQFVEGVANEVSRHEGDKARKIEEQFTPSSERFGVSSASLGRQDSVFQLISNVFLARSNFFDAADFPWDREIYRINNSGMFSRDLSEMSLSDKVQSKWLKHVEEGIEQYSSAYGMRRPRAHRGEGALTLAYAETLDQLVRNSGSLLRIGLVTRARQVHHAIAVARTAAGYGERELLPAVFHPRLLNAFMIDQSWDDEDADGVNRRVASQSARNAIIELQSALLIIVDFLEPFQKPTIREPLSRWITVQLRRAWEEYRRQGLAEQIKIRIGQREDRWKLKRNPRIQEHMRSLVGLKLHRTQMAREQALINSLPVQELPEGVSVKILTEDGPDETLVVLIRAQNFAHAIRFYSEDTKRSISRLSRGGVVDVNAVFESVKKDVGVLSGEYHEASPFALKVQRFDILLLHAIISVASEQSAVAQTFLDAALDIWRIYDFANDRERRISAGQRREGDLLVGYINRRSWLDLAFASNVSGSSATRLYKWGIDLLGTLSVSINLNDTGHFLDDIDVRLLILVISITRDLNAFAFQHGLLQNEIPLGVNSCVFWLEQGYRLSKERQRFFTAARAKQQIIAFARIYQRGGIPQNEELSALFSTPDIKFHYRDLIIVMAALRQTTPFILDEDLPNPLIIYEALGKWICREDLGTTIVEITRGIRNIEERLQSRAANEKMFAEYVGEMLTDMRSYILLSTRS